MISYFHLPKQHPLAIKISNLLKEQEETRKVWLAFIAEIGAKDATGNGIFFFAENKKPNKLWIKAKKQKWDDTGFIVSKKTAEGKILYDKVDKLPERLGGGTSLMLSLFSDEPSLNIVTEDSSQCLIFNALSEHGSIGFKRKGEEIYVNGSSFWFFGNMEGVEELTASEYSSK